MRTFNVETQTDPAKDYSYGSAQQMLLATDCKAKRILQWRYAFRLPQYVIDAIDAAGYGVCRIGCTTYKSSTWALYKREKRINDQQYRHNRCCISCIP